MLLSLSQRDVRILLGAQLMSFGVPFYRTTKPDLAPYEVIMEELRSRLIKERNAILDARTGGASDERESSFLELSLSPDEIRGGRIVLEACLAECGDDPTDLELHLRTRERQDVERLLAKFLGARGK
ncbi:hypothetical protein [Tuwongella immobilis]|uniref:Uncharacterized protein n=1 Tax=Tuwongella immobilis TaxID=692036 RepID=A0A6C2YKJ0_9BACT|nr:hypothetical protein [Tuwongella immobilis]VIP02088.1 unnamed protein product [Tuwongella immobilis]VTS00350.1 unnamed protein product [Tuwongella immobilis]